MIGSSKRKSHRSRGEYGSNKQDHGGSKSRGSRKQRMWKSLSRVLRRHKSTYSALRETDDSRSPIAVDFNCNNCAADELDWRTLSIHSNGGHEESIDAAPPASRLALSQRSGRRSLPHNGSHPMSRAEHASADSSDSSSSISDASTINNNHEHPRHSHLTNGHRGGADAEIKRRKEELQVRKLELQIEFYESMNRLRPRVERAIDRLESYLDSKVRWKPSDDLKFL